MHTHIRTYTHIQVPVLKAQPMPDFSRVFKPQLSHKSTDSQPFSFEGHYRTKDEVVTELARKEEEIAAQVWFWELSSKLSLNLSVLCLEEGILSLPYARSQSTSCTASQAPSSLNKSGTISTDDRRAWRTAHKDILRKGRTLRAQRSTIHNTLLGNTCTSTLVLTTLLAHILHVNLCITQVSEELQQTRKMAEFKASDPKVLYNQPFLPARSTKPLTESSNVMMHTDLRMEQRVMFDEVVKKIQKEREQEEAERRTVLEAKEAEEIKQLRRSQVHKPQPIQHYPPITVHPSLKPLTDPVVPVLTAGTRLRGQATQL